MGQRRKGVDLFGALQPTARAGDGPDRLFPAHRSTGHRRGVPARFHRASRRPVSTAVLIPCDPYNPLLGLYSESRRYDQSWAVVRRALKAGKWVAPDLLAILKKESGRGN